MKNTITFIFCFITIGAFAQRGKVTVLKNPLIDSLIARRLALSKDNNPIVSEMGYRVQIYYGPDRRETFSEQARFKSDYPKLNTYITYKEPNYYLRVGDFRTRIEAQRLMNDLRASYPTLFIFREKITQSRIDDSHED